MVRLATSVVKTLQRLLSQGLCWRRGEKVTHASFPIEYRGASCEHEAYANLAEIDFVTLDTAARRAIIRGFANNV